MHLLVHLYKWDSYGTIWLCNVKFADILIKLYWRCFYPSYKFCTYFMKILIEIFRDQLGTSFNCPLLFFRKTLLATFLFSYRFLNKNPIFFEIISISNNFDKCSFIQRFFVCFEKCFISSTFKFAFSIPFFQNFFL